MTDIEGTTRDILEEQIQFGGLTLNMIDTAGIRDTSDLIEQMGVDKAEKYVRDADLVIYVADASRKFDQNDERIMGLISDKKTVVLLNKSDLKTELTKEILQNKMSIILKNENNAGIVAKNIPMIDISVKEELGIQEFEKLLTEMFLNGEVSFNEEIYITNVRHKSALSDAYESLDKVIVSIENRLPEDFYSIDLMDAYDSLGSITGETIGEDLINEIFSKFCMGK